MKILRRTRRPGLALGILIAVLVVPAVALAAVGSKPAPALPDRIANAPELSAVTLSSAQKAFVQVQFDRGLVKVVDRQARTITILQRQQGHVWRTQAFTVPPGTDIFVAGAASPLRAVKVGMHARIEQTAVVGSALAVVRVDAQSGREETLPPTTSTGAPLTGSSSTPSGAASTPGNTHPHLLPPRFSGAPEVAAVVFSSASHGFIERLFDRGVITSATSSSSGNVITIVQRQNGHVWRTQTFTIPSTAKVVVNTSAGVLSAGLHVRIEQTGPVGGTLAVVRVDARATQDVSLPPTSG